MALFDESYTKAIIDDTENLYCTVENTQNINKHTEYRLRVERGPSKENKWNVSRRYRDFAGLHASIHQANIDLPLPPKKLIGNMQPSFVAERQVALQNYINEVLKHQILALSLQVRSFLDPVNYSLAFAEQALQTVSIALRGDGKYELKGPLGDIGWRIRKHYFLVTDIETKSNCMLSWQNYGPDRSLSDKDLQTACKSLLHLYHPYIDEVLAIHSLESGVYVVRRVHENGSLRDMLYGTEYNRSHLAKYGNPRVRKPFTLGQIAHYGYQILLALKFLHEKGLPHGHIHPGNIAIENQRAVLLDVENILVGAPCLARPHLLAGRFASLEAIDVYCFGRTLYEMAFAKPLEDYYCDYYPDGISQNLESVLQLCISSTSCKHGGPSIEELLQQSLFARGHLSGLTALHDARGHLKFPITLKDQLRTLVYTVQDRLKSDQKSIRNARREVRIQEILNSEEELKKHKRRARKRESLWKSTSSLAETVRSHSASTASTPTPPALPAEVCSPHSQSNGRSALLAAICSFDKGQLARAAR